MRPKSLIVSISKDTFIQDKEKATEIRSLKDGAFYTIYHKSYDEHFDMDIYRKVGPLYFEYRTSADQKFPASSEMSTFVHVQLDWAFSFVNTGFTDEWYAVPLD